MVSMKNLITLKKLSKAGGLVMYQINGVPMTKDEYELLKVKDIKELLKGDVSVEFLTFVQNDKRNTVRKLGESYIGRQKKAFAEQQRLQAMYMYEESFYNEGLYYIAGVDEVGRGPIAGPVTVAAVILPPNLYLKGLNDSKKVKPEDRNRLYDEIMEKAIAVSCVSYGPDIIDKHNIYEATRLAMYEAINTLEIKPEAILVDAMKLPNLAVPVESLIKGDSKSASIAAASIIAKVTRDRYMEEMDKEYPGFGFAIHKGYYTELHKEAITNLGITPIHRHSFEPIKSVVKYHK